MKKGTSILTIIAVAAIVGLSSCKKFDPWGNEPGGGSTTTTTGTTGTTGTDPSDCSMKGTLVSIPCAISDLNNLWILGDDGNYYQPCDASILNRMDYAGTLSEGSRITFGYSKMTSGCSGENRISCPTNWPNRTKISLTCITPFSVEEPRMCKPIETVSQINPYRGNVEILRANREGNCLKMLVRYSSAVPVETANFSLTWDGSIAKTNPATTTLYLDHIPTGVNSQIVQVEEVSFDVSQISDVHGTAVKIKIDGYDDLF